MISSTVPFAVFSTARDVIVAAQAAGVTFRVEDDRIVASPKRAVTAQIREGVAAHRPAIVATLTGTQSAADAPSAMPAAASDASLWPSVPPDALFVGGVVIPSPAHCWTCGNADFHFLPTTGWHCCFCAPPLNADGVPQPPTINVGRGNIARYVLGSANFTASHLAALWPALWTPPQPLGRSAREAAGWSVEERERPVAAWRAEVGVR